MPTPLLKSLAEKANLSLDEVESKWEGAKKIAGSKFKEKDASFYAYSVGILKNMLSVSSRVKVVKNRAKRDHKGRTWWDKQTREQQIIYLKKHPESAGKYKVKGNKTTEIPVDPVVLDQVQLTKVRPIDILPDKVYIVRPLEQPKIEDLTDLTISMRKQLANTVGKGMSKITHILKDKPLIFTNGFKSLNKLKNEETLHTEDKYYIHDMLSLVMSVVLVSVDMFGPCVPYSKEIAEFYLEYLGKPLKRKVGPKTNRKIKDHLGIDTLVDPTVIDELDIETDDISKQMIQHLAQNILDWLCLQDIEDLLDEAKRRNHDNSN